MMFNLGNGESDEKGHYLKLCLDGDYIYNNWQLFLGKFEAYGHRSIIYNDIKANIVGRCLKFLSFILSHAIMKKLCTFCMKVEVVLN